jgi:hypothetical protein
VAQVDCQPTIEERLVATLYFLQSLQLAVVVEDHSLLHRLQVVQAVLAVVLSAKLEQQELLIKVLQVETQQLLAVTLEVAVAVLAQ